ncbi:MAG: hypothetical protein Tsb009_23750 [Planctomycetaceae bacterium]
MRELARSNELKRLHGSLKNLGNQCTWVTQPFNRGMRGNPNCCHVSGKAGGEVQLPGFVA